ncbi:MAG TPA: hypothetical protein PLP29_06670 [Candidatus Ozemobacteraceae bacterium]|nr:hypothetical protein [Candidatus Ozemobacteraceae bacterium]
MTRRNPPSATALLALFLVLAPALLTAAGFRNVASETAFWDGLETSVASALLPIAPAMDALHLDLSVKEGENVRGSGSIRLRNGDHALLSLSSRDAAFRYLAVGASASCLLELAGERTLFVSGPDREVPIPTVRIDRSPDGEFNLNLVMNLAVLIATRPIDLGVDPGTPAHIAKKLRTNLPWCRETSGMLEFSARETASPTVLLLRGPVGITGFELRFPREQGPEIRVRVDPLAVGPAAPVSRVEPFPEARQAQPGADTLITFMRGFYAVLSSMIPQ